MLAALVDGAVRAPPFWRRRPAWRLPRWAAVLLGRELAGRVRRTAAGIQEVGPREAAGREGTCAEPTWLSQPAPTLRPGRRCRLPPATSYRSTAPQEAALFRQGDVLLVPIPEAELPAAVVPVAPDARGVLVLALGEATGHAHAVRSGDVDLLADAAELDRRFLRIVSDAVLTHEEHHPIPLPPGLYQVVRQREYESGESRIVDD